MRAFEVKAITLVFSLLLATSVMAQDNSLQWGDLLAESENSATLQLNSEWDNWNVAQFEELEWYGFSVEEIEERSRMFSEYFQLDTENNFETIEDFNSIDPYSYDGGGKIGNGGKVFVCGDQAFVTDYVWGMDAYGFAPITFAGDNEFEKAANIIGRLKEKDPYRYKRYMIDLLKFKQESVFLSNYKMGITNDIAVPGMPRGCVRRLVVNQIVPTMIGEYRYRINKDLATVLDADTFAGIIVHEIIYKEAIELGHSTDTSVKYLNAYLASKQFDDDTVSDYQLKLLNAGFSYILNGIKLEIGSIEIDENNNIVKGRIAADTSVEMNGNKYTFIKNSEISFFSNGQIKSGWLTSSPVNVYRTPDEESILFLGARSYSNAMVIFNETGFPKLLEVAQGQVMVEDGLQDVEADSVVEFYEDGTVKSFYLANDIQIERMKVSSKTAVILYPSGKLKSFSVMPFSTINSKFRFKGGLVRLDEFGKLTEFLK